MTNVWILVIGMAIVTYIPRMVPMVFIKEFKLPPFVKRFLEFVPYAVLGALIFPGIVYSTNSIPSAIFGGTIAVIVGLFNVNLIFVVFSGIAGVYLWDFIL